MGRAGGGERGSSWATLGRAGGKGGGDGLGPAGAWAGPVWADGIGFHPFLFLFPFLFPTNSN